MSFLEARDNNALVTNPTQGARVLTTGGSSWLFAVTAVFILLFLLHLALSMKRRGERVFSYIFALALLAGALAYFAMASDLGSRAVRTSSGRMAFDSYQIFWPKYAYWAVSFAAVILALGLISGIAFATILFCIGLAWLWVFSYFISAMTATKYKWGFFALGTVAWLALAVITMTAARDSARGLGVGGHYTGLAGWVNLLWLMYPIAFGLSDGGNVIGVTAGHIWFGILDLLMLPIVSLAFVFLSKKWDHNRLGLGYTERSRIRGYHYGDKHAPVGTSTSTGTAAPVTTGQRTAV